MMVATASAVMVVLILVVVVDVLDSNKLIDRIWHGGKKAYTIQR